MDARDKTRRAAEARRLMDEPLLMEALASLEKDAVERIVEARGWRLGDKQRRIAAEQIRVIRGIRNHLELVIIQGPRERVKSVA